MSLNSAAASVWILHQSWHANDGIVTMRRRFIALDTLANSSAGFCLKNSYGRGAGTMPQSCDGNQDHLGLLCYDKCPTNYTRQALDCHQNCPSDFEDQGLFCRKADYGRGAGYPWKFGDGFNLNKARKRCENITALAIAKRAARSFTPSANLATTPLDAAFAVLCSKYVKIDKPHSGKCSTGLQSQAGLCYKPCKSSYSGVGPVCWAGNPSGWVNCGFGAAQSPQRCAEVIQDQIMSVDQLAFNILTEGEAMEAGEGMKLQDAFKGIQGKDVIKQAMSKLMTAFGDMTKLDSSTDPADIIRLAAGIAAMFDPTGVADVVQSYAYSTCDKYGAGQVHKRTKPDD
ncbi:hypothetical protein Ae201684P_013413 [Aphanomyces euteiches]|nr:hypothetical protein Ae201684P_013413 [Aphanomyces euteiches]